MMTAAKPNKNAQSKPAPEGKPAPAPTPEPTPAAAEAAPAATAPVATAVTGNAKQAATLALLKTAWKARKVDLSKMTVTQDGKYIVVVVGEAWPKITIGNGGGIDLPEIKSYPKAFDAAVVADQLWEKQSKRGQPKPPTALAAAVQPEAPESRNASGQEGRAA